MAQKLRKLVPKFFYLRYYVAGFDLDKIRGGQVVHFLFDRKGTVYVGRNGYLEVCYLIPKKAYSYVHSKKPFML